MKKHNSASEITERAKFDLIRYAQCWEDADILLKALNIQEGQTCLSIASAGDNSLALLTKNPAKVIALDISPAQIFCLELRVAAYRHLNHSELLELMGSYPSERRKTLYERCLPGLSGDCATFWQVRIGDVERFGIGGVGKFENYFRLFRRYILPMICSAKEREDLFRPKNEAQRLEFYEKNWNTWRWRFLLRLFFAKVVVGRLGRDPAFFKYVEGSLPEHIGQRVRHAMTTLEPAKNPYLQWIFTGRHIKALPLALRPENFEIICSNLDRLEWRLESAEEFVKSGEKIHAFNLSNIFEYMSEDAYEELYGTLLSIAAPGARFAYWNMMVPRQVMQTSLDKVTPLSDLSGKLYKQDKAFFYSNFHVEEVQ